MSGTPRPAAPGYAYPNTPPPGGYYAYNNGTPPPTDYEHHYEPHGQSYGYNPYAFAPPPQQPGYYPAAVVPQPEAPEPQIISYSFVRAPHNGWHVFDPHGSLIFDVTYKKAGWFEHDGCEVHHGEGGVRLFICHAFPTITYQSKPRLHTPPPTRQYATKKIQTP